MNNFAEITGTIVSNFIFSHECKGGKFYEIKLEALRQSGATDTVRIIVSDHLLDVKTENGFVGKRARVTGQVRTYNRYIEGKNKLEIFIFANDFSLDTDSLEINRICLDGFVCKEPIYRKTPLGREITDVLIATNRQYCKSDYIPCILWGRNARYASKLEVGTHIQLEGRIQSREYLKKLDDGSYETRTAYEASVSRIDVVEESEENEDEQQRCNNTSPKV